jgi:hypothetical protein
VVRGPKAGVSQVAIGDQRLDTDDVHDPCQIVGQDRKRAISAAALGSVSVRKCVAPIEP